MWGSVTISLFEVVAVLVAGVDRLVQRCFKFSSSIKPSSEKTQLVMPAWGRPLLPWECGGWAGSPGPSPRAGLRMQPVFNRWVETLGADNSAVSQEPIFPRKVATGLKKWINYSQFFDLHFLQFLLHVHTPFTSPHSALNLAFSTFS